MDYSLIIVWRKKNYKLFQVSSSKKKVLHRNLQTPTSGRHLISDQKILGRFQLFSSTRVALKSQTKREKLFFENKKKVWVDAKHFIICVEISFLKHQLYLLTNSVALRWDENTCIFRNRDQAHIKKRRWELKLRSNEAFCEWLHE